MEDHTWRRCDCSLPGRGTPAVWSQDARSGPQSARGTPATRPGDLSAGPVQGRSWRDNMRRHGCCTSFPRGHLQLSVTSRCCRCLLIGINLHQLLSRSRCSCCTLPSECARVQTNSFHRTKKKSPAPELACLLVPAQDERA